jgi:hypothetical protein
MKYLLTPSKTEKTPIPELKNLGMVSMPDFVPEAWQPKPVFKISDLLAPKEPKISDLVKRVFEQSK